MTSRLMMLGSRFALRNTPRMFNTSAVRLRTSKDEEYPNTQKLATVIENKKTLLRLGGNDNPYNLKVIKRGVSTKEQPIEIPSAFKARIVGCLCEEDSSHIKWMWLHSGEPKRCLCGHWFNLVFKEALV